MATARAWLREASTADQSASFHKTEFDEMPCKLESTENLRSFEKSPSLPYAKKNKRMDLRISNVIIYLGVHQI